MVNCKTIKSCASAVRFLFARKKKHFLCEKMLKKMLKKLVEKMLKKVKKQKKCFRLFCSSQKRERFLVEIRGIICGKNGIIGEF